tara:strand:+ start:1255 stop:1473 length:219 start_codon:yes stop_codon:yes gene_type:complete
MHNSSYKDFKIFSDYIAKSYYLKPTINYHFLDIKIDAQTLFDSGAVAQMGERSNRTAEVRGSNPLGSTKTYL